MSALRQLAEKHLRAAAEKTVPANQLADVGLTAEARAQASIALAYAILDLADAVRQR